VRLVWRNTCEGSFSTAWDTVRHLWIAPLVTDVGKSLGMRRSEGIDDGFKMLDAYELMILMGLIDEHLDEHIDGCSLGSVSRRDVHLSLKMAG
jgi:hypothetical protein